MFRIILFSEMESSNIILIIQQTDASKLLLYYGSYLLQNTGSISPVPLKFNKNSKFGVWFHWRFVLFILFLSGCHRRQEETVLIYNHGFERMWNSQIAAYTTTGSFIGSFFHKNRQFFEVFEMTRNPSSLILTFVSKNAFPPKTQNQ